MEKPCLKKTRQTSWQWRETLGRLATLDPQQAKIVELRVFGGLTMEEVAEVLGISPATVKRELAVAKAWLTREMNQP